MHEHKKCDWEIIAPPSKCGKPAEYASNTGIHYCKYHGEHMARKFPEIVKKLTTTAPK
jgi:hypothetical protein